MTTYTIEASGSNVSGRVVKKVSTATDALTQYWEFYRVFGKGGQIDVFIDQGKTVRLVRLEQLALRERDSAS